MSSHAPTRPDVTRPDVTDLSHAVEAGHLVLGTMQRRCPRQCIGCNPIIAAPTLFEAQTAVAIPIGDTRLSGVAKHRRLGGQWNIGRTVRLPPVRITERLRLQRVRAAIR